MCNNFPIISTRRTNDTRPVKTNFENLAKVIVIDSGVHHRIAAGQYRIRRTECEELAKFFKVDSLRNLQIKLSSLEDLCKGMLRTEHY